MRLTTTYERVVSQWEDLAQEVQDYPGVQPLFGAILDGLLLLEGPPPYPIPDLSTEQVDLLVKTPARGHSILVAHSWVTGPWTCLLLDMPMPSLARPRIVPATEDNPARIVTDSKSMWAEGRIAYSALAFALNETPYDQAVVFTRFGTHQTFLAWRPPTPAEINNPSIRFDVDNALKLCLDGLSRAGVLLNDKGVVRAITSKEMDPGAWDAQTPELQPWLEEQAVLRVQDGEDLEAVRLDLGLTRKTMKRLFPKAGQGRPAVPADDGSGTVLSLEDLVRLAAESSHSFAHLAKTHRVKVRDLRNTGVALARQALLDGQSPRSVAKLAQMKAFSLRRRFAKDPEVIEALAKQGIGLKALAPFPLSKARQEARDARAKTASKTAAKADSKKADKKPRKAQAPKPKAAPAARKPKRKGDISPRTKARKPAKPSKPPKKP